MKILILLTVPFPEVDSLRSLNHVENEVTYLATTDVLTSIPESLPCKKYFRPGFHRLAIEALKIFRNQMDFDRVVSVTERDLGEAALIRMAFGIQGLKPSDVENIRDQITMKNSVSTKGILVPKFIRLSDFLKNLSLPYWFGNTILKSVDMTMESHFSIHEDIPSALQCFHDLSFSGKDPWNFELEERIHGRLLMFDGLVVSGSIVNFMASEHLCDGSEISNGKPLGSCQLGYSEDWLHWAQTCINALKIDNSSFHLEAIETDEGLVFFNAYPRVNGANAIKIYEMATGVHLPSAELKLQVGIQSDFELKKNFESYYGWFSTNPESENSSVTGIVKASNSHSLKQLMHDILKNVS